MVHVPSASSHRQRSQRGVRVVPGQAMSRRLRVKDVHRRVSTGIRCARCCAPSLAVLRTIQKGLPLTCLLVLNKDCEGYTYFSAGDRPSKVVMSRFFNLCPSIFSSTPWHRVLLFLVQLVFVDRYEQLSKKLTDFPFVVRSATSTETIEKPPREQPGR